MNTVLNNSKKIVTYMKGRLKKFYPFDTVNASIIDQVQIIITISGTTRLFIINAAKNKYLLNVLVQPLPYLIVITKNKRNAIKSTA